MIFVGWFQVCLRVALCRCLLYTQFWRICLVSSLEQMKFLTWMLFILFSGNFLIYPSSYFYLNY